MVRFKAVVSAFLGRRPGRVSIPLWCDLKRQGVAFFIRSESVSIPLWCDLKRSARGEEADIVFRFHPTMVRFKAVSGSPPGTFPRRFHPTMVRFKGVMASKSRSTSSVSIPLWCDLKASASSAEVTDLARFHPTMVRFKDGGVGPAARAEARFHPTMVRFKAGITAPLALVAKCFHPTMVRFKVRWDIHETRQVVVSIPLWCDLKQVGYIQQPGRNPFPSHYGAI